MENVIIHGQYSSNVNEGSIVIKTKETIASSGCRRGGFLYKPANPPHKIVVHGEQIICGSLCKARWIRGKPARTHKHREPIARGGHRTLPPHSAAPPSLPRAHAQTPRVPVRVLSRRLSSGRRLAAPKLRPHRAAPASPLPTAGAAPKLWPRRPCIVAAKPHIPRREPASRKQTTRPCSQCPAAPQSPHAS